MSEYRPDSWVMIKMTYMDKVFYKVLGGWAGGYTQGSSWRLNSGVDKVEVEGDLYKFHGSSGSVYICSKHGYGLRMSTASIWEQMKERFPDNVELLEDCDWSQFEYGVK